jgi:hypothetical protein
LERQTDCPIKYVFQIGVHVVVVRGVEGEKSDGMLPRELTKNVVAADFSTGIGWDQAASFYPKYFHATSWMPKWPGAGDSWRQPA